MEYIISVHITLPVDLMRNISSAKKEMDVEYPNNYNYDPHITLYLGRCDKNIFKDAYHDISDLKFKKFKIKIDGIKQSITKDNNLFLYLNIDKSSKIYSIHKDIIEAINQLRGNKIRKKDADRIKSEIYSPLQIKYVKKFGCAQVMRFFNPHITLGIMDKDADDKKRIYSMLNSGLKGLKNKSYLIDKLVVGMYLLDTDKNEYKARHTEKSVLLK